MKYEIILTSVFKKELKQIKKKTQRFRKIN